MIKKYSISMLILCLTVLSQTNFAQDNLTNNPYSLRLIRPLAYSQEPTSDAIISVGPFDNYQISTSNGFAETDGAVNRLNPNNFVGTDNRVTGFAGTPLIYYTSNGGVSWSTASISGNQGDPAFAADSMGNFYLAVLQNGILVYKSTNSGVSWFSLGLVVSNANADKEWIACDQTNGTYKNNVYAAYVNFATGGGVDFWRSTNNGTSWLGPIVIAAGNQGANPGPNIAVGRDGRVYVVWNTSSGASLKYSTDGGATFSATTYSASSYVQPGTLNSTSGRYCVKGNIRTNGHPQLAVDLTNGPYKDYVYCQYATNPAGPDIADVFVVRSTDKGLTWGVPVRCNSSDATTRDNWMGDVSVDYQGRVWAHWYDSRNDASNILTEIWGAVSTDGGATFNDFKISNQNFNPNSVKIYQGTEHYYFGDYTGMSGSVNYTFPVYTGQNNTLQDYVAYLPDYGIAFSKPVDSINVNQTALNRVRIPMMGNYSGTVTYTATVLNPPGTGTITFSWVPGNVKTLSGNPDSLILNSIVSAGVPFANYNIRVTAVESSGPRTHFRDYTLVVANVTGVSTQQNVANIYSLRQNYPNPFNPSTSIDYSVAKQSVVSLKIFDVLGREIAVLVNNEVKQAGSYNAVFNASNLPSGIYYYQIKAGDFTDTKKMILTK